MTRLRAWGWETAVFRFATAAALVHALDDAFFNRQPGVPLDQQALAGAVALATGVGAAAVWPRLRPGFRAAIAIVFGVLALVNGTQHVIQIGEQCAANSDFTGVVAVAAGAVLVLLGLATPFLHRGAGARTRGRRWAYRVVAILGGAVLLYVFLVPVSGAIVQTHKYREAIPDVPPRGFDPVRFRSSDGLELSGWYRPSTNRAAVIIVHGGGGDRTGGLRHAQLLARHGYGALVYDSRGRGQSEGSHNALGWGWEKDVAGALAFLQRRRDVDPGRIGGLGLSTGADVLIEVAANDRRLKAVVSDGATARSFADQRNVAGIDEAAPFFWSLITAVRVFSGSSPGEPLEELVAKVSPTPLLLIAAGRFQNEREFNLVYANAAREPFEFWDARDVNHTAAIHERPRQYERRVVGFFDRALLESSRR